MSDLLLALAALIPSLGVALMFFLTIRYIVHADRNERAAEERMDTFNQFHESASAGRLDHPE